MMGFGGIADAAIAECPNADTAQNLGSLIITITGRACQLGLTAATPQMHPSGASPAARIYGNH